MYVSVEAIQGQGIRYKPPIELDFVWSPAS